MKRKKKPKNSLRNTIVEVVCIIILAIGIASIIPCWLFYKEVIWSVIMGASLILSFIIDFLFTDKKAKQKYIQEIVEYEEENW